MTTFVTLSPLVRAFFALWALLLCLTNIVSALLALGKKHYLFSGAAVVLFAPLFFLWQVIFDLSLAGKTGSIADVSRWIGNVAWVWGLVAFLALTLTTLLLLGYNIRYEKNYITPNSIKVYLDKIPCGVCCWRESGRVLFSNICMNRLCVAMTGGPLLNGNHFREAVKDGMLTADGKMWRFTCRETTLNGELLYEMIASDVTTEYAETQALERDKAELSRLNRELKEYTRGIDDIVRHQEILQAKVNIHDEMNRLMLSTMVAESEDVATLDKIFALWEQNALLLCMEADETSDQKAATRIEELAKALKITMTWRDAVPTGLSDEQRSLFYSAAQEAIANAAKHAQAKEIVISFTQDGSTLSCHFTNDGNVPRGDVRFSGGLANLTRLADKMGATVSARTDEKFTLTLVFPAENNPNG